LLSDDPDHPFSGLYLRRFLQSNRDTNLDWYRIVKSDYDRDRRLARVFHWCKKPRIVRHSVAFRAKTPAPKSICTEAEREKFAALAEQWRRETRFSSSVTEKVMHSAYQSIIAMGRSAVPLVLQELQSRRGHWFWALHFMTGSDPVPSGANIDDARDAWLAWGKQKRYIK
jgi:hypothetical protein